MFFLTTAPLGVFRLPRITEINLTVFCVKTLFMIPT